MIFDVLYITPNYIIAKQNFVLCLNCAARGIHAIDSPNVWLFVALLITVIYFVWDMWS